MLTPHAGVYAAVPVCRPSDWMNAVEFALSLPAVEALRRRLRVAGPQTVLTAAREWASAADRTTGRNVAVSHATVAGQIGYAEATVKRIMRFLTRLGFVVECARGRNRLTLDELATARALGAESQRAAASTRALTIPRTVDGTPLPLSGTVNERSPVRKNSPKRAKRARKAGAPHRPAIDETNSDQPRWPLATQQFAAQLVDRLPRLLRTPRVQPHRHVIRSHENRNDAIWLGGRHIGQVCSAIARARLVERGWTVAQVLDRVNQHSVLIRSNVEPAEQRDPLAWLFWLIRQAIAPNELSPRLRAEAEREHRRAAAAAAAAEDRARRAQIQSEQEQIDLILADMHRRFPSRRHASAAQDHRPQCAQPS